MSTITSQRNTEASLLSSFDEAVITMGESFVRKKKFGVGSGYSREDFQELKRLEKIICRGSCNMDSDLYKKVKEKLNKLSKKYM